MALNPLFLPSIQFQRITKIRPIHCQKVAKASISELTTRNIPGDYGLPIIGPLKDRLDYFYNQGREEFFKSRVQKYQSTVFRTNMPPGPFISSNPHVVVLLDAKSFPVLFDTNKVEKKDLFTGTYMSSMELTGGYRVLSYLDPSEPKHKKLKQLIFSLLKSRREFVIPEFQACYGELFETLEAELSSKGNVQSLRNSFSSSGRNALRSFISGQFRPGCYFRPELNT